MSGAGNAAPRPARAGLVVSDLTDYGAGISAIDTAHLRPRLDASHLVIHRGRGAFIDTGTAHAVPHLLAALKTTELAPEAVDWVFLTHIHLDHAGGAGALLAHLPNARVVVHPRGAPHLADPSRLVAATRAVYGAAAYAALFGEIVPIAPERILASSDGLRLALAGRAFEFFDTPGHALHHCAILDHETGGIFGGDTFGVSYREFDVAGREFVFPATTPSQFDPAQLDASIDRILDRAPRAVYLTHYGRVSDIARLGRELHRGVAAYVELARRNAGAADRIARMRADMFRYLSAALDEHGFDADAVRRHALLDLDIELNVDGLAAWLDRQSA